MRAVYALAVITAALVLAAGCASVSPRANIEGLSYGVQPYDDLPVPQDFTFDASEESWAYRRYENTALNLRVGRFRYVGDRDVGQLVNWYNEQMPKHGWQQKTLNWNETKTAATLSFTRNEERAVVEIARKHGPPRPEPYTEIVLSVGLEMASK